MNEELFQYIWMAGLFNANGLKTNDGQDVIIYQRGKQNTDSGPDFSNAHIRIADTNWVGNVELHILSDEWNQHRHDKDKAYNSTILHVVYKNTADCQRQDGSVLPCIELCERIPDGVIEKYEGLRKGGNWIACENVIRHIDNFTVGLTLNRNMIKRLERKCDRVNEHLLQAGNDWNSVFYHALARSFGFGTNSDAYEQLATNLPLNILFRHRDNAIQTEALVFGMAGFLDEKKGDKHYKELKSEWDFLSVKYKLKALDKVHFKFMRMRPGNFPGIRLAQFAAMAVACDHIFSAVCDKDTKAVTTALNFKINEYWEKHYHFGKISAKHGTGITPALVQQILINAVAPVLFVFGKHSGSELHCEKALELLQSLPSENNSVISGWKKLGIHAANAFDSQALLELKTMQCDKKKCLHCIIGNKVMNL